MRDDLKIYYLITPHERGDEDYILHRDFTTLGLIKASPKYDKGRKYESSYYNDEAQTDIVVKKSFTDRIENSKIVGIDITIDWYNTTDAVALTKQDFKPLNVTEVATLERSRRVRAIDYLRGTAVGTPVEPHILAIFSHYEDLIRLWENTGTSDLLDAVNNETDATILSYFAIDLGGYTVKDSIVLQIS